MARFRSLFLLAAAALAACGPLPVIATRHVQVEEALQSAASQVRRCYRAPQVSGEGRLIVTRVRVRLTREGELMGLPVLLAQDGVTRSNASYAPRMAQAAIAAVMRCAPLRLPPGLYLDGWSMFDLTFSPTAVA